MSVEKYFVPEGANEDLRVAERPGTVHVGDDEFQTRISTKVRFRPRPRFVMTARIEPDLVQGMRLAIEDRPVGIRLDGDDTPRDVILTHTEPGDPLTLKMTLPGGFLVDGEESDAKEVGCHLVNLPDFVTRANARNGPRGLTLQDELFEVKLDATPTADEIFAGLKSEGGFGITHVGRIRRRDEEDIPFDLAQGQLHKIHTFLSFVRGASVGLLLPMGWDDDGVVRWTEWGDRQVTEWKGILSWSDRKHGNEVELAYRGFSRRWEDSYWRDVFKTCVYWYTRSNSAGAGVDGGLILTQAALEKVAAACLMEEWGSLSPDGFKKLPASDRLRLTLSRMKVPLEIPDVMPELAALAKAFNWDDGPAAVTEVRNHLVHADRKSRLAGRNVPYHEAWNLGQWYLELALLNLCDFRGKYGDRRPLARRVGEVTPVPWSSAV